MAAMQHMVQIVGAIVAWGLAMTAVAQTNQPVYTVHRVDNVPAVTDPWDSPAWRSAQTITVSGFHPKSSGHRPETWVRLLHDGQSLAVMFRVEDRYVLARETEYQSPTHRDSCVEFFAKPRSDAGYFNFEFNAIGTLLLWYVRDPRRVNGDFADYEEVPKQWADTIAVHTSLTGPISEEIQDPVLWTISYRIPLDLFEAFAGEPGPLSGQQWTGNFYKCADDSSHPHWGYWSNIGERLDFHQPRRFGVLKFE